MSHGVADLPPMRVDEEERTLTATLALPGMKPRTVVVRPAGRSARVDVLGPKPGARTEQVLRSVLHRVLNLDEDLSGFYEAAAADPELAWATAGAGRMLRSPTVFEEGREDELSHNNAQRLRVDAYLRWLVKVHTSTSPQFTLTFRLVPVPEGPGPPLRVQAIELV